MVFIYLEKAYDSVRRQEVCRCLREQVVPEKYVRLVKDTYEDARTPHKSRPVYLLEESTCRQKA